MINIDILLDNYRINAIKANISYEINIEVISQIKEELKKYKDIFSIWETSYLLSYKSYDYISKTIIDLLFNSLYNLFNIKLIILRSYFNDTLTKE